MRYILILLILTTVAQAQKYHRLDKPQEGQVHEVFNDLIFCDTDTLVVEPIGTTQLLSDGAGYFISVTVNPITIDYKYFGTLINCYNFKDSTRTLHIIGVTTPKLFYHSYKIY